MRIAALRPLALVLLVVPVLLTACGGGDTETDVSTAGDPAERYTKLLGMLEKGEVENAYAEFLPPSYERDIERVFSKIRSLIGRPEYEKVRKIVATLGEKLGPILVDIAKDHSAEVKKALAGLNDLPATLGIETYSDFEQLTARKLISRLERGFVRQVMIDPEFRKKIGDMTVVAPKIGRHYAVLEILSKDENGKDSATTFEVVRVDGHWVPSTLAKAWKNDIRVISDGLDQQLEAKEQNPDLLLGNLADFEQDIDKLVSMLGGLIRLAG